MNLQSITDSIDGEWVCSLTQRQLELGALRDAIDRYCFLSDLGSTWTLTDDEEAEVDACAKHIARECGGLEVVR